MAAIARSAAGGSVAASGTALGGAQGTNSQALAASTIMNAGYGGAMQGYAGQASTLGADATLCEACRTPIFPGDLYHAGVDPLCLECAPTYQSIINEPEMFVELTDESPSDPDELRAAYDAHIAAGGSPDDKMVEVYD